MRRIGLLVIGLLVALGGVARGQDVDTSFTGVVTGDNVYVRSGQDTNYYAVTKLSKGAIVRVLDARESYGFYAIDPVPATSCLISKQYTRLDDSGTTATVTGNRVIVRIENPGVRPVDKEFKDFHYRRALQLNAGDSVRVVGENEGYYRIVPPRGVKYYISSKYVAPATPAQIRAAQQRKAEAEQPVEVEVEAVEVEVVEAEAEEGVGELMINTAVEITEGAVEVTGDVVEGTGEVAGDVAEGTVEVARDLAEALDGDAEPAERVAEESAEEVATEEAEEEFVAVSRTTDDGIVITESDAIDIPDDEPAEETTEVKVVAVESSETTQATEEVEFEVVAAAVETETAVDVEPEPIVAEVVVPNETIELPEGDLEERLGFLEEQYETESDKALREQNATGLLIAYRSFDGETGLSDLQRIIVDSRVKVLTSRVAHQQLMAKMDAQRGGQRTNDQYTAVGKLLASMIYTGDDAPLLYRLADPLTGLTIGYVQPGNRRGMNLYLGQVVGVVGPTRYDSALRLKVIELESIDRLSASP